MTAKTPSPAAGEGKSPRRAGAKPPRIGDEWWWVAYGLALVAFVAIAPHL